MESNVYVVDDDHAVGEGVSQLVRQFGWNCECYSSADSFLSAVPPGRSGCAIIDVRMPGMDGLQLLQQLAGRNASLRFILVSGHGDVKTAVRAMRLGAATFLEKPFCPQELVSALREVLDAGPPEDPRRLPAELEPPPAEGAPNLEELTDQERAILQLTIRGHTVVQIAERLDISPRTVQLRRARLMSRLGASTKQELIDLAIAAGILRTAPPPRSWPTGGRG